MSICLNKLIVSSENTIPEVISNNELVSDFEIDREGGQSENKTIKLFSEVISSNQESHCSFCIPELFPKVDEKPLLLVFIDMDGVLIGDRFTTSLSKKIKKSLEKMVPEKGRVWSQLQWRIAAAEYLDPDAVTKLKSLFNIASKTHFVRFVVSSGWRNDGTLKQVREEMFKIHFFSEYIIGKTSPGEADSWAPEYEIDNGSYITKAHEKYDIRLTHRADEIEFWLRDHQIDSATPFVILDDCDDGLSEKYPKNFVHTKSVLLEEDIEKALSCLGLKQDENKSTDQSHLCCLVS